MTIGKSAVVVLAMTVALSASQAHAQAREARSDALEQMTGLVESLVQGVSQSVVQVLVTSYGPVDDAGRSNTDLVIGRQRRMGSGVVIDAGGYIVTNAHVVSNARRVEVVLPGAARNDGGAHSLVTGRRAHPSSERRDQ